MVVVQAPKWLEMVAVIPAAVIMWALVIWTPKTRQQWYMAAAAVLYIAAVYVIFIRNH